MTAVTQEIVGHPPLATSNMHVIRDVNKLGVCWICEPLARATPQQAYRILLRPR